MVFHVAVWASALRAHTHRAKILRFIIRHDDAAPLHGDMWSSKGQPSTDKTNGRILFPLEGPLNKSLLFHEGGKRRELICLPLFLNYE